MSDVIDPATKSGAEKPGADSSAAEDSGLERGTYEIIRGRLESAADELRQRLEKLNAERREVFGSIPTELIATDRVSTSNNCVPCDMIPVGNRFLFGFNVNIGLKSETAVSDVFAVFSLDENDKKTFHAEPLDLLADSNFQHDFGQLYKYYKNARFVKFRQIGVWLYMVFQIGESTGDIKSFKWRLADGQLDYQDNRSDHEVTYPPQHEFEWIRTHRDLHRSGPHPHVSIEDRVFVETVGGDLTIKIEDNTADGLGIYREPVEDPDQTLDDAEMFYSIVGNLILLKVRPFREDRYRYFVFNEKLQTVTRLDALSHACILLPEDHGLIFSNGYYLQSGEHKTFPTDSTDLLFEKRIASPNGEDYLFVFYNPASGAYILLPYNMIGQTVDTPVQCHGYSIFPNGHLIYFKSDGTAQKHHAIQIWQTPFTAEEITTRDQTDSYLFKIGNRDVVRGMAECHEVIGLIRNREAYADIYIDIARKATDILDSWFWIDHAGAFDLGQTIGQIRDTANAAIEEFEKVRRIRASTRARTAETTNEVRGVLSGSSRSTYRSIEEYVDALAQLRASRGKVVTLRELKYVDLPALDALEEEIRDQTEKLSQDCVRFLLQDNSLEPYTRRVAEQDSRIDPLETVAEAKKLDEEIAAGAGQLEMLIDIVSNLKIEDATQRTQIIDDISVIYSRINKTRARLRNRIRSLMSSEGAAEFNSRLKLLSQAVANYLDVCDSPAKCDEYLTKMMVQIEELEGRFAEFDEFVVQLAEKRDEVYEAFDSKKLQLIEARNRRANSLATAADRILKGISTRISNFESVDEINSYFASDLMIDKVRDIVEQLEGLDESVKVDDIQSRLKTVREDAVRQLKDKNELFVEGQNLIRLGKHRFTVNVQPLDLTSVPRDDGMFFHLTGTNFFERIEAAEISEHRELWDQALVSENAEVCRAEYLAFLMLHDSGLRGKLADDAEAVARQALVFMSPRYSEGYVKGVHDHDAGLILQHLLKLRKQLGLLKYPDMARAIATLYWTTLKDDEAARKQATARIRSLGDAFQRFGNAEGRNACVDRLATEIEALRSGISLGTPADSTLAAGYLFDEVSSEHGHAHRNAIGLARGLTDYLKHHKLSAGFREQLDSLDSPLSRFHVIREWLAGFASRSPAPDSTAALRKDSPAEPPARPGLIAEAAAILVDDSVDSRTPLEGTTTMEIENMLSDHRLVQHGKYTLDFHDFQKRLNHFRTVTVPAFHAYHATKHRILESRKKELRLDEFKPRVLTSFVRNRLINDVYLPMVGDNLAKQIGVAGEGKRTDLMGLLLLVSPPGYGKTTLMEYIANRLGLTFMKINGPAIGHQVTSLDPAEAANASAREEVEKLNLALEMGDNVMIYLDDIQHCHPEFLQKFISLCDATRRIEGVFRGKSRTYDLRGRKVAVVMAGNPYTESGDRFRIPDMLANRADTYNLGDVIGDQAEAFELSYLENCLTSNPTLASLHTRNRDDVYSIIDLAAGEDAGHAAGVEGNFSVEEISEFVAVMKKLVQIRDVVLKVNQQYIESAAQSDDYRTEPPFKLQGSYRDMNKLAEALVPVMNDEELMTLIVSHYENQAQTLTSGAQANLLKFSELIGTMTEQQRQRWNDIKKTFKRNLVLGTAGADDKVGQIIARMTTFADGLNDIRVALDSGIAKLTTPADDGENTLETATLRQVGFAVEQLAGFNETLRDIKGLMESTARPADRDRTDSPAAATPQTIEVVNKVPQAFSNIIEAQFRILQTWLEPLLKLSETIPEVQGLVKATKLTEKQYRKMMEKFDSLEAAGAEKPAAKKPRASKKKSSTRKKKSR